MVNKRSFKKNKAKGQKKNNMAVMMSHRNWIEKVFRYQKIMSLFSGKSEGRKIIRFRMGHVTSSKEHNIF